MSNPKVHVIKAASGKFTITGQPALLTITPAKINTAIEKSNLLDIKKVNIRLTPSSLIPISYVVFFDTAYMG